MVIHGNPPWVRGIHPLRQVQQWLGDVVELRQDAMAQGKNHSLDLGEATSGRGWGISGGFV